MADKDPGSVKVSSLPFYRDAPRSEYSARPEEASVLRDGFRAAREGVTEVVEAGREARDAVNHVVISVLGCTTSTPESKSAQITWQTI